MGVDSISGHPLRHFDFFAVYRFAAVQKLTGLVMGILAPFIYGLVMAVSAVSGIQLYGAKRLWDADTGRTEVS